MTYRAVTKCADCGDVLWFGVNDVVPQDVICPCGATELSESGPSGSFTEPTTAELEAIV